MQDGNHEFYTIQFKKKEETPWCQPHEPFGPPKHEKEYDWCNFDWRGRCGYGLNQEIGDDSYNVWCQIGTYGVTTEELAYRVLLICRQHSRDGKLDSKDSHGTLCQRNRYKFRVIKVTVSQRTEILD